MKKGTEALNIAYKSITDYMYSFEDGRKLELRNAHFDQVLAYRVCRDLGLVCKFDDHKHGDFGGCNDSPRAQGFCQKHYDQLRRKAMKEAYDEVRRRNNDNS